MGLGERVFLVVSLVALLAVGLNSDRHVDFAAEQRHPADEVAPGAFGSVSTPSGQSADPYTFNSNLIFSRFNDFGYFKLDPGAGAAEIQGSVQASTALFGDGPIGGNVTISGNLRAEDGIKTDKVKGSSIGLGPLKCAMVAGSAGSGTFDEMCSGAIGGSFALAVACDGIDHPEAPGDACNSGGDDWCKRAYFEKTPINAVCGGLGGDHDEVLVTCCTPTPGAFGS